MTRLKRGSLLFSGVVTVAVHLAFFQNCSEQRFIASSEAGTSPSKSSGGGSNGGFDGMVYAALGSCPANHASSTLSYESIVVLARDYSNVAVLRRGCRDLASSERRIYSAAQFTFTTPDRNTLVVDGVPYYLLNSPTVPTPVERQWSCALAKGGEVAVYRDPLLPALYYAQYRGPNRTGTSVGTGIVNVVKSTSTSGEAFSAAPLDLSASAPPPYLDVRIPLQGDGSVRYQDDAGGVVTQDCKSEGPSPAPSASPTPSPSPSSTPASLTWRYFGQISQASLYLIGMRYCGVEAVAPGTCSQRNSTCWIYSGSFYDQGAEDTFYNFFSCQ